MNAYNILTFWASDPRLSGLIWTAILIIALYCGRAAAHVFIINAARAVKALLRLSAGSLSSLEKRVAARNKEVILDTGRRSVEKTIEREFHRVNNIVDRDLSAYPAIHRKVADAIEKIEKDYQDSTQSPPSPPGWLEAIDTIAGASKQGDASVNEILSSMLDTIEGSHEKTLTAYRKDSLSRLQILKNMLPSWRRLSDDVSRVKNMITDLKDRANFIDEQMHTYEAIRASEDKVARLLTSSSLTQFFVSGLVLLIAVMGGVINFQLIALPMSEMVDGTSQLGSWRTADVAAMVIIMIEVAMGIFLLESLRITRLFPVISSMDDRMRKRMLIVTLTLLTILASVESSLAYMRDLLALDREALAQTLAGIQAVNPEFRWIPSVGQMILGFILPFSLAFVAIPLESFIQSSRTVLGLLTAGMLRALSNVLRVLAHGVQQIGRVLVSAYDVVIFLPLRLEQFVSDRRNARAVSHAANADVPVLFDSVRHNKGV